MQKAKNIIPEAIIIGTGKGSMHDTELFLGAIKEYKETALNATNFIHSTYNQLNGMIALSQKINSYNTTYVHRGFSLEHALIDAQMLLQDNAYKTGLVGSYDEMTTDHYNIKKTWNFWKKEEINNLELYNHSNSEGTIAGEGAGFFLLSNEKQEKPVVAISFITTLYKPSFADFEEKINDIISSTKINLDEIDIVISGKNGDANQQGFFDILSEKTINAISINFKHLTGEYDTAVNFAIGLGNAILLEQKIPTYLFDEKNSSKKYKKILIYNNYFELNQSLILLEIEL